jgi:hypothetical protein
MTSASAETGRIPWRRELHALFSLREGPWRWSIGAQVGAALGIPLTIFTLTGHQAEGLIASLGAFTAIYKAPMRRVDRLRSLPVIGAGFVLASIIGVMASYSTWLMPASLILVAAVATGTALRVTLGPPGPMMFMLVTGVTAYMSTPASRGGPGLDRMTIPLYVAIGAAGAVLVIVAPLLLPSIRRREGAPSPLHLLFPSDQLDRASLIILLRVMTAVSVATLIAIPGDFGHAYWVVYIAGVLLQTTHSLRLTLVRAVHRVFGTLIGLGMFALVLLFKPDDLWLVLVLVALQGITEVVVTRNYGLALVFITPLALTIGTSGGSGDVSTVVSDRVVDTLLGSLMAVFVLVASQWAIDRYLPETSAAV